MANKFQEFQLQYQSLGHRLVYAVAIVLPNYRAVVKFPASADDENSQCRYICRQIDKLKFSSTRLVRPEWEGPDNVTNYADRFTRWSKPLSSKSRRPRAKTMLEALTIFYYLMYLHTDLNGKPDNQFGLNILELIEKSDESKNNNQTSGEVSTEAPDPLNSTSGPEYSAALAGISTDSKTNNNPVPLHLPQEIFGEEAWLNPNNFTSIPLFGRKKEFELLNRFLSVEFPFQILPIIAPSGAGKTRLVNEWLNRHIDVTLWDAGILNDPDVEFWESWKPTKNTLIVIDYLHQYQDAIKAVVNATARAIGIKIRLVLIDHIFPEQLENLPRDTILSSIASDASILDERAKYFYDEGPLWLARLPDRSEILTNIISHVSNLPPENEIVGQAFAQLEEFGDFALHPLFAALIGFAICNDDFELPTKSGRRYLIRYYFDKKQRLPWLESEAETGRWVGAFVAAATVRKGALFDTLAEFLPDDFDKTRTGLRSIFDRCNRIVSSGKDELLISFQPDLLGETFFLMFITEFSSDHRSGFWRAFCSMVEGANPDDADWTYGISLFMQNLLRNLCNDDQTNSYVKSFWKSLLIFLRPENFTPNTYFRLTISEALIQCASIEKCPDEIRVKALHQVDLDDVLKVCLNHPNAGFHLLGKLIGCAEIAFEISAAAVSAIEAVISFLKKEDISDAYILRIACEYNYTHLLIHLVEERILDPNAPDENGLTSLHFAMVFKNDYPLYALLKHKEIDLNVRTVKGATPLHFAALLNRYDILPILFQLEDFKPNTPGINDGSALLFACQVKSIDFAIALITQPIVDINLSNKFGITPLMGASANGCHDIVASLLERSEIEINKQSTEGLTAIHAACIQGHSQIVSLLLNYNGKCKIDPNIMIKNLGTPLLCACARGHKETVVNLLKRDDIDTEIKNSDNKTAAEVARELGYDQIADLVDVYSKTPKRL